MKLPFNILEQNYKKPSLYLCEVDKQKICELEPINMSGSFKFNAYSELAFTVPRTYTNMITGETDVNPYYDKIEALRLVYLEGFGYFEIQEPEIESNGIREVKNVTAYSLEYTLSQKYLEEFYVNTGEINSIEVQVAGGSRIIPVTLYNEIKPELSLLDLVLEKIYGWKIGHIDDSLKTMSRQFEISRASVYDFIVQDLCEKFNCYAVFDTIENKINLYAESLITKFIGDGVKTSFTLPSPYKTIYSATIDSYKTTAYTYEFAEDPLTNTKTGILTFDIPPSNGAKIEVTDGYQEQHITDVYVTFDNLAQEVNVSYSAEDIKTVLTVRGQDDLSIREVNMGLPYITDLSYYYTVDWMGQELYDVYTKYLQSYNSEQEEYQKNSELMLILDDYITYETNRVSLQYSIADNVTSTTVGTYYIRGGNSEEGYYYTEVTLPEDWNVDVTYYTLSGTDLDKTKFANLYNAFLTYYKSEDKKDTSEIEKYKENFMFMEIYTIDDLILNLSSASTLEQKDKEIDTFLDEMWNQLGLYSLNDNYLIPYKASWQEISKEQGYDDPSNENYWTYHVATVVVDSLTSEIEERKATIAEYQEHYDVLSNKNKEITNGLVMETFFKKYYEENGFDSNTSKSKALQLLMRLSPFLREDEYTDDNFVETDLDTTETLMKTKKELMECGRIELQKLSSPKLSFSMNMANIYALIEFEPIINQFQLGKLINVAIRSDYIKRARLLSVDINFDDFSDFTCEFGELTNLKTPSSIHADLLASALSAGKSVASSQSYWNKGSDLATSTDLKIQNGLLSAVDGIYNSDKSVLIDNHGILLRKVEDNGEYSPYQIWLTNNNILISTDAFETAQTGIGVFEVDGRELYGVLAKAILSGYIESSHIVGGTIKIGEQLDGSYAFEVHEDGTVTMSASGTTIDGYAKEEYVDTSVQNIQEQVDEIAVTLQIYTASGNVFSDNKTEIELMTSSLSGITPITGESYKWYYYSAIDETWIEIGDTINLIVPRDASYALSTFKCVMVYNGKEYEDFFSLNDAHNQYTASIKFFNGTGTFGESEQFLVAYISLFKNGIEMDKLATTQYYYNTNNTVDEAGLITTDISNTNIENEDLMYFILGDSSVGYSIVLGQYNSESNSWVVIDEDREFAYTNNMYANKESKIIVISREDVTDHCELIFNVHSWNLDIDNNYVCNYDSLIVQAYTIITNITGIMGDTIETVNNINQYMKFDPNSGLKIAQDSDKFYVNIDSTEMGFYDNTDASNPHNKIVNIGTNSATIKNMVVISDGSTPAQFNCDVEFNQPINIQGFIFQKENNGSFSLVISK